MANLQRRKAMATNIRFLVSLVAAIVLVLATFSHRPVLATETGSQIELAAYAFPDGSTPSLCLGGTADSGSNSAASQECLFCRLVNIAALPSPIEFSIAAPLGQKPAECLMASEYPSSIFLTSIRSRAPPQPA